MIREITQELAAELASIGCPIRVLNGPEPTTTTTWGRERIVLEHADSDSFDRDVGQSINPKIRYKRNIGLKLTIYAQSTSAGATEFEHRRRAEKALDAVIVAFDNIAALRRNPWGPTSGAFVVPPDLAKSETQAGAVYELHLTFGRGIAERNWAGDTQDEFTILADTITNTVEISQTTSTATAETIGV